jgi:hypothetical protein
MRFPPWDAPDNESEPHGTPESVPPWILDFLRELFFSNVGDVDVFHIMDIEGVVVWRTIGWPSAIWSDLHSVRLRVEGFAPEPWRGPEAWQVSIDSATAGGAILWRGLMELAGLALAVLLVGQSIVFRMELNNATESRCSECGSRGVRKAGPDEPVRIM